jgi:hypothetical protein
VDRPIDASEQSAANEIEDLVVAVIEADAIAADEAFDLIAGQDLSANERLEELVRRDIATTDRRPDFLQLMFINEAEVERALSDLVDV